MNAVKLLLIVFVFFYTQIQT